MKVRHCCVLEGYQKIFKKTEKSAGKADCLLSAAIVISEDFQKRAKGYQWEEDNTVRKGIL